MAWTDHRHINALYCPHFVYMCFTSVTLLMITFYFEISKYEQCYNRVVYTKDLFFPLRYNRQSNAGQDLYGLTWTRSISRARQNVQHRVWHATVQLHVVPQSPSYTSINILWWSLFLLHVNSNSMIYICTKKVSCSNTFIY